MITEKENESIKQAAEALKRNEIAAIPTETVYGLAANALSEAAVKKIFEAKGRPQNNPLIVHISEISQMEQYAFPDERAYLLAETFWPGPLTIIMKKREIIPLVVTAGLDSVGLRMPENEIARKIISLAGVPLAAPSANLSGKPSPTKAEHVKNDYAGKLDQNGKPLVRWIVDGGECACGVESTVVSLLDEIPVLLRPGFVTFEELRKVLPNLMIAPGVVQKIETEKPLSPGLVHRHYAADADTEGVEGESAFASLYINKESKNFQNPAVMCFRGEESLYSPDFRTAVYGDFKKPEELAKNLFDCLRELDGERHGKIFIRLPSPDGVGLAVYNRLLRSCEFQVTRCPPFAIGLTGQSGAGKGTIAKELEKHGFYHIDGDRLAGDAYADVQEELTEVFGEDILKNGVISREKLSQKVFSLPHGLDRLNPIIHGSILQKAIRIAERQAKIGRPSVFDGAALFESGADRLCKMVVAVVAPEEKRLPRVLKRDGISKEQALRRFSGQKNDDFYTEKSDLVLCNDGSCSVEFLAEKILKNLSEKK